MNKQKKPADLLDLAYVSHPKYRPGDLHWCRSHVLRSMGYEEVSSLSIEALPRKTRFEIQALARMLDARGKLSLAAHFLCLGRKYLRSGLEYLYESLRVLAYGCASLLTSLLYRVLLAFLR